MKRRLAALSTAAVMLVACGGAPAAGPKSGVHDMGGSDAFNASLVTDDVIADVTIDPARVGTVLIHMEFTPPGGELRQIESVTGNLIPADRALSTLILWFERSGTNHFHYEVAVPTPGEWTLEFDAAFADGTAVLYTTTIDFTS